MGYYMWDHFQNFNHLIKIYIQCTIQNSQTSKQFCCQKIGGFYWGVDLCHVTRNHVTYIKSSTGINKHQQLLNFNHIIPWGLSLLINSISSFIDFILAKPLVRYNPLLVLALVPSQKFILNISLTSPSPLVVILSNYPQPMSDMQSTLLPLGMLKQ